MQVATARAATPARSRIVVVSILQILAASAFLAAGITKLVGTEPMVAMYDRLDMATRIVAIFFQFAVFHASAVTAIVLLILTSTIAWLRRDSLPQACLSRQERSLVRERVQ